MDDKLRTQAQPNNKFLGLELIRFIAAMAVLIWHYQHFSFIGDTPINFSPQKQPFYSFLKIFYDYGHYGVQVFWCISGFIFFWKYRSAVAGRLISPKTFFILRFSRLYPLHIATLLLVALLQIIYFYNNKIYFTFQNNDFFHFFLQIFFASSWVAETGHSFNAPIWSISVEVLVYLFFFITLRFLGKSTVLNILVLLACLFAKYAKITTPLITCIAFFYIGGLTALIFLKAEKTKYCGISKLLSICIVVLSPVAIYNYSAYRQKYFAILFLATYTPVLLYSLSGNVKTHPSVKSIIEAAGNMTYSSYLIHFPIQLAIAISFGYFHTAIPLYNPIFFITFMSATLALSCLIYRYFEMPSQSWIREKFK